MPKYLYAKVTVRTYETFADSEKEAGEYIRRWETGESEEPEPGIKATSYKLFWEEFENTDEEIAEKRNEVLAGFLNLIQNKIPGFTPPEESKIIQL